MPSKSRENNAIPLIFDGVKLYVFVLAVSICLSLVKSHESSLFPIMASADQLERDFIFYYIFQKWLQTAIAVYK